MDRTSIKTCERLGETCKIPRNSESYRSRANTMTKRIRLEAPNKEEYLKNIDNIESVNCYEKITWLAFSDLDVSFYRVDEDMTIEYTKKDMQISIEQNWEVRPDNKETHGEKS